MNGTIQANILLGWRYFLPVFERPPRRISLLHMLRFIEAAALFDHCISPLFMWPDKTPWFINKATAEEYWINWLGDYGFPADLVQSIVTVADYPIDPYKWDAIENYLEAIGVQMGHINSMLHAVLAAEFARRQKYSYTPGPDLGESFAFDIVPKFSSDFSDALIMAYREMRISIDEDWRRLEEYGNQSEIRFPPFATYILQRSRRIEDIPSELMAVRAELETVRQGLSAYQQAVIDTDAPLKRRLRAREELVKILAELKRPMTGRGIAAFEWTDILTLPDQLFDGPDWKDFKSSSLLKFLLTKPKDVLLRAFRRRKLGILFRAKETLYSSSTRVQIERLFGRGALNKM